MQRILLTILAFLIVFAFIGGCSTVQKMPGMSKISSTKKESDDGLFRKVPASMRADVKEAEFDLKRAKSNANLAEKKLKLSELKKEREILENKYAKYNTNLAAVLVKKADIRVAIKKMEAIDNSNLGNKEDNINRIASLKTKQLSIESDAIEIKADMDTTKLRIKQLTKKIKVHEKKIKKK
jgi:chromosome segregation ATPase